MPVKLLLPLLLLLANGVIDSDNGLWPQRD